MSLSAAANAAIARRTDFKRPAATKSPYRELARELAAASEGQPGADNAVTAAIKVITTYIPTEILTLYVAVLAALRPKSGDGGVASLSLELAFWGFLLATPVVAWILFATKLKAAGKSLPLAPKRWPMWEMMAGAIAFTAWALTMPENPYAQSPWYSPSMSAIVVLISSATLGLIAPLFGDLPA